jgi:hypothetical protein
LLFNSKSEYKRCAVSGLTTKIGDNNYKKWEKDLEKENVDLIQKKKKKDL